MKDKLVKFRKVVHCAEAENRLQNSAKKAEKTWCSVYGSGGLYGPHDLLR